jgi:hypothetical protein
MKFVKISLIILLSTLFSFSEDEVGYSTQTFTRVRQVADAVPALDMSVGTSVYSMRLARTTASIYIKNDHSTNTVYFNPSGAIPLNATGTTMITTEGSAEVDFNTPIAALGLEKGSLISLNEGDANDGMYSITSFIAGTNKVRLDRVLAVTNSADQDYRLSSIPVKAGESFSFDVGTNVFSLVASGASTTVRIVVAYQQGA